MNRNMENSAVKYLRAEVVLQVLMALLGALALIIFNQVAEDIREMKVEFRDMSKSVEGLNKEMAALGVRVNTTERRVDRIEENEQ